MRRWFAAALLLACLGAVAATPEVSAAQAAPSEEVLASAVRDVHAGSPATAIVELQALESGSLPPSVQAQTDLLLGVLLLKQERLVEALPRLERASTTYPLLADYAFWHLAGAYRKTGQSAAAALALRRLIDQYPNSLLFERASRALPRDLLEAGDLAHAEEAAGKYLAAFPQGPGRAEVWTTLGEVLLQTGRLDKGEEVLRRVWIELPGSAESLRARDLLATIPGDPAKTAAESAGAEPVRPKPGRRVAGGGDGAASTGPSREHVVVVRVYDRFENMGSAKFVLRGR